MNSKNKINYISPDLLMITGSASEKFRNSYFIKTPFGSIIIDPQNNSLQVLIDTIKSKAKLKSQIILIASHEHENHYNGLKEMAMFCSEAGMEVKTLLTVETLAKSEPRDFDYGPVTTVSAPTTISSGGKILERRKNELKNGYHLEILRGHCSNMIGMYWSAENQYYYSSDNITVGFPSPITDGGSIINMISFLKHIIKRGRNIILPGHGNRPSLSYLTSYLKYYRMLLSQEEIELSTSGYDMTILSNEIELYHQLNKKHVERLMQNTNMGKHQF